MKVLYKREVGIALLFFVTGFGVHYFISQKTVTTNKKLFNAFTEACMREYTVQAKLYENCAQTYRETMTCVFQGSKCNTVESGKRLEQIGTEEKNLLQESKRVGTTLQFTANHLGK